MPDIISTLGAFIAAIAILITVHEYGHFAVARFFNVKVLKFSIGFGPSLFKFKGKKDQTEFALAVIPLGGYVKMLDESEGDVTEQERHRAFNCKNVYQRFAVVFAGPFVNFIFAIFAFFLMYSVGIQGIKPTIGNIEQQSLVWQSGLREGDVIEQVDGKATPTWGAMHEALIPFFINRENVTLQISNLNLATLAFSQIPSDIELKDFSQYVGLKLFIPKIPAIVSDVVLGSPADKAKLQKNDEITALDGIPISSWQEMVAYVKDKPHQWININLVRQNKELQLRLKTSSTERNGQQVGLLGVRHEQSEAFRKAFFVTNQYDLLPALSQAVSKTWDMSILTLNMMGKMLLGQASIENISGPITIAEVAGHSYRQGVEYFLRFLAIVSLSLGVINLLPIPLLDGGHLLFYLYEMVTGKPVPKKQQDFLYKIGVAILLLLMSIAFYNDITRLLL